MILLLSHVRPDGETDTYHLKPGRRYHLGRGSTCEIRLLDLKLSRRHCAVEYSAGEWKVVDLGSTNGCRVSGDLISGAAVLAPRSQIEIGASVLQVYRILGEDEEAPEDVSGLRTALDLPSDGSGISSFRPAYAVAGIPATAEPPADEHTQLGNRVIDSGEIAAGELLNPNATPEPASEPQRRTDVLTPLKTPPPAAPVPVRQPAAVRTPAPIPVPKLKTLDEAAADKTLVMPAKPAETTTGPSQQGPSTSALEPAKRPATTGADGERAFYITVLGTRIGPLNRTQARDLKARELRGELSQADLVAFPKA